MILAPSEIGNVIALPTSAVDTPGGTPMAFIASARGIVDGAGGCSGLVSAVVAFGCVVVTACSCAVGGNETPAMALSEIGMLEALSCVALASRGFEGIMNTFIWRDSFTPFRNAWPSPLPFQEVC